MDLPTDYRSLDWQNRKAVREEYVTRQKGLCRHCSAPLEGDAPSKVTSRHINWTRFPKNFLKHPVHLHHNHRTGQTIGAVHAYCNAVLWQYHGE